MSATRTAPHLSLPGSSRWPGFLRKKVTVAVACTTGPAACPVVPSSPLGTSTARTGLPAPLMAATASAAAPSMVRERPAPNMASMMTSAPLSAAAGRVSISPSQRPAMAAASPRRASRLPSSHTRTPWPCSRSIRAATKPSPPLLPGPQRTATEKRAPPSSAAAAATARPAASISAKPGVPALMARRSARPISSVVSSSCPDKVLPQNSWQCPSHHACVSLIRQRPEPRVKAMSMK